MCRPNLTYGFLAAASLIAMAAAQPGADPQIMTENGNVRIKADDVVFEVSPAGGDPDPAEFTVTSIVDTIASNQAATATEFSVAASQRAELADEVANTVNVQIAAIRTDLGTLETTLTDQVAASASSMQSTLTASIAEVTTEVQTGVSRALAAAATVKIPITNSTENIACDANAAGAVTYVATADGCHLVVMCTGTALTDISFDGPALGSVACNPAPSCRHAVGDSGVGGEFFIGNRTHNARTKCDATGLEAGNGSAESPGLSCASIFEHYPSLRARGKQTYKMLTPDNHLSPVGFTGRGAWEGGTITCRGTGTRKIVKYGATSGSTHRYSFRFLPPGNTASIRCTNGNFGDPWPGARKGCYCGVVSAAATRDVVCDPRMDPRIYKGGLIGWWKAEDYKLPGFPGSWKSINPRADYSHLANAGQLPVISRVATVSNPRGLSRGWGFNSAHENYGSLQSITSPSQKTPNSRGFPHPGQPGAQFNFGQIPSQYAICTTSRYLAGGGNHGRIFVADRGNWLHGHWSGRTAVVHYDRWVTYRSRGYRYDWVVSCTTYSGGRTHYTNGGVQWRMWAVSTAGNRDIGIGIGAYENREISHYAVGEVLLWGRALSASQLRAASLYLTDRLNNRG